MKAEEKKGAESALRIQAIDDLQRDMESRDIAAILWDNSRTSFHYIPEVKNDNGKVKRIMGLYNYAGKLYLVEEGEAKIDIDKLYDKDTEVKPTVVTLTADSATDILGNPSEEKGYTDKADMEEWMVIADCYFEALAE